jgi:hypothetical protein
VYNFFEIERFRWEGPAALTPGKHTVVFDFKYDGPGFGKGGAGVLSVDGKEVASKTIPHTIPFVETIDETFDVGVDTRTGVDDNDYQPPYRFTGKIDKLTVKLVPLNAAGRLSWRPLSYDGAISAIQRVFRAYSGFTAACRPLD